MPNILQTSYMNGPQRARAVPARGGNQLFADWLQRYNGSPSVVPSHVAVAFLYSHGAQVRAHVLQNIERLGCRRGTTS